MKKIVFVAIMIISSYAAIGQTLTPLYSNRYMLPECWNTNIFNEPFPTDYTYYCIHSYYASAIAQPYISDSVMMIKGIATLAWISLAWEFGINSNCELYLSIYKDLDSMPLASLRYDTLINNNNYMTPKYIELFFDSAISISGNFYIVSTLPLFTYYNPSFEVTYICGTADHIPTNMTPSKTCCSLLAPLIKTLDSVNWHPIATTGWGLGYNDPIDFFQGCNPSLFLFPILDTIQPVYASIDSTSCNNDTASHRVFLTTTINTQTYPTSALIMEVGFIYSTDTYEELILDNPNVNYVSIPCDSTTNTYTMAFPYSQLPCQYIYYRSYVKTVIETSYDTMEHVNYGETNFFIKREESSVETLPASYDTDQQCVVMNMNVTNYGCPSATAYGFVYDKDSTNLNLENGYVHTNSTNTSLSYLYLQYDTIYYYKSFITSNGQTHYGNTEQFSIQDNSLNEIIDSDNIAKLYPNPTDKELTVETTIPIQKIEVINSNGQTIYTVEPNKKEIKINTSKFVTGNYIAVITTSKGVIKRQFVVR